MSRTQAETRQNTDLRKPLFTEKVPEPTVKQQYQVKVATCPAALKPTDKEIKAAYCFFSFQAFLKMQHDRVHTHFHLQVLPDSVSWLLRR